MDWFRIIKDDDIDEVAEALETPVSEQQIIADEDICCKEAKQNSILRSNLPYLDDAKRSAIMKKTSCDALKRRFETRHDMTTTRTIYMGAGEEQSQIEARILTEWNACIERENRRMGLGRAGFV